MEEFDYRIRWRTRGVRPGIHLGTMLGAGTEVHTHVGILDAGDPRRLDLRASIASPGGRGASGSTARPARSRWRCWRTCPPPWATRAALQTGAAGTAGAHPRRSAQRAGDRFTFLAADAQLRDDLFLPPTRAYGAVAELAARLEQDHPAVAATPD